MENIEINNLSFQYGKSRPILNKINLTIPLHSFSLLEGPTGSGKSTFLKILAGLYPKYGGKLTSGKIHINNQRVAMMFQDPGEQFTMTTAREEIIFALENLNVSAQEYPIRLQEAISFAKLDKLVDRKINNLSGGEKQRVALGVLVAMQVDFLLDEPFASVDPIERKILIKQLAQLQQAGKTIIITDHVFDDYQSVVTNVFSFEQKQIISLNEKQKEKLFAKRPKVTLQFALPDNDTNIFDFKNVEIKQVKPLIEQESLEIYQGKTTLLTGKNGTGKSTLFKVLTKMLPYNGSITYLNKEINKYRTFAYLQHVAQIFQNASDQFLMITVEEEIELSKKHRVNSYFTDDKITQALAELNLSTHLKQVVYTLSGGQKKKLQILLMLISGHEVLLIDEPLSGLDQESTVKVLQLIKESQKEMKQTIILISHQLHDLQNFCDYHLNLANKQLTYTTGVNYES